MAISFASANDDMSTLSARFRRDDQQVEEIRRRMAALRHELDGDVNEVGRSARAMTDWQYYVKHYPWASLALAAVAGYFLVPKRPYIVTPNPNDLAKLAQREKLIVTNKPVTKASQGLAQTLFTIAATGAARAAMGYIGDAHGSASGKAEQEVPDDRTVPTSRR